MNRNGDLVYLVFGYRYGGTLQVIKFNNIII